MVLTFELDPDSVELNQHGKWVTGHIVQEVLFGHTDTHTHTYSTCPIDCSALVAKMVSNDTGTEDLLNAETT